MAAIRLTSASVHSPVDAYRRLRGFQLCSQRPKDAVRRAFPAVHAHARLALLVRQLELHQADRFQRRPSPPRAQQIQPRLL